MRRRWCNLAVALCRSYRPRSQWRKIVSVDDVVGQSRMIRILRKKFLQQCPGLELLCISLIGRIGGCRESQSVENCSFDITGVSSTDTRHCAFVRQYTRTLIGIRGVGKEMCDSLDIGAFTFRLRTCGARLLNGFKSLVQLRLGLKTGGKGVTPLAQRNTPVGDRT